MTAIKNIVFDLGAVLIDIDFNKVKQAFEDIGIPDFDLQFSQIKASPLFEHLETGKITDNEFYEAIKKQTRQPLSNNDIQQAWNAILLDFRKKSMDYVTELKQDFRLFLLSNTNSIHLEEVHRIAQKQLGVNTLDVFFEKAYYSHKIGLRKPYESTFNFVLQDAKIQAHETFFVDDAPPNTEAAAALGLHTHLLLPHERIENILPAKIK